MKKRVKLLTTIASLCLAVALMAFGVYAANQSTLTLGSSVSFSSDNVAVSYTVEVDWTTNVKRKDDSATVVTTDAEKGITATDTANKLTVTGSQGLQIADRTYNWELGDYEFDAEKVANGETIVYKVTIVNDANNDITVTLTNGVIAGTYGGVKVTVEGFGDGASATGSADIIDMNSDVVYTVTYEMVDNAVDGKDIPEFAPTFTTKEKVSE